MKDLPPEAETLLETCKHLLLFSDIADPFTFQTFAEGDKPSFYPPAILHGTIEEHWDRLCSLNSQRHGIFIMVNQGDGQGRSEKNVTGLRALFIDEDTNPISKPFHLPPSLIVQSSPGKRHIYWKLKPGLPLDAFKAAQQRLAGYYGTDPKVCDLPRVLRLSGFLHQKGEPFPVTVIESNVEAAYSVDEVLTGIPELQAPVDTKPIPVEKVEASKSLYGVVPMEYRVDAAITFLQDAPPAISGAGGHTTLMGIAGALINGFLLDYSTALDLIINHYNERCEPSFSVKDIEHKLTDATNKPSRHSPDNYLTNALERLYREQCRAKSEPAIDVAMPSKDKKRLLKWRSAPEFALSTPVEIPWLVENLFALKAITEIDGKVKTAGKSTFVCAAAKKVLHGEPFLNFPTFKTNVLYLSEAPETAWRQTLERADLLEEPGFFFISTKEVMEAQPQDGKRLTFTDIMTDAVAHAMEVDAKFIIVDTLSEFADFADEKENDSGASKKVTDVLKMAANAGMSVVVLRHDRKSGGNIGDSARGSSALTGQVDNIVHIEEPSGSLTSNQRYLSVKGRLGDGFSRRILEVNTANWEYSLEQDLSSDVRASTLRSFILTLLPNDEAEAISRATTETSFKTFVVERSKTGDRFRKSEVSEQLKAMILDGSVGTAHMKAKGNPKLVFKGATAPARIFSPDIYSDSLDS